MSMQLFKFLLLIDLPDLWLVSCSIGSVIHNVWHVIQWAIHHI